MLSLIRFAVCLSAFLFTTLKADPYPIYAQVGFGYDYFRCIPEGDWEGNTGALIDTNFAITSPCLLDYGVGFQLGGSYGVYDWAGRGSSPSGTQNCTQRQAFVTAALFRKAACSGINAGFAFDWMWNQNASVFAIDHSISQFRFQVGYLFCQKDELGFWGTLDTQTAHRKSLGIPVSFRAISQINFFWEHSFDNCAKTMLWAGLPYKESLMFSSGRAGKFILGASFHAPLSYGFSIDGHASYMDGHSAPGALKQRNYAANIFLELNWAFGGECGFSPYMPIGNNSNFFVDSNITF